MKNLYKLLIVIILMISANSLHSQYSLWTWGSNHNGQLGNDRAEDAPLPILINDDGDWEKVYSYYAIKKDGTLWTWGNRNVNPINEEQGIGIRLFDDSKWEKIITSERGWTTYGIKQDGSLWSWGYYHYGWLILEDSTLRDKIINEPVLIDSTHNWREIEISGRSFVLGIDDKGYLYTWGRYWSTMGIGEIEVPDDYMINSITKVGDSNNWINISSTALRHTFGVQENGSIWFWGNDSDKLVDTIHENYSHPMKLGDYNCVDIRTNEIGTIFTNSNGEIYSIGEFNSVATTKPNKLGSGNKAPIKIVDTDESCFAIQYDDYCIFLGGNKGLKFGPDHKDSYYNSFIAPYFQSMKGYKDIAQIGNGFIFIDSLNDLRAWGDNSNGELANVKSSFYKEPINIMPNKYFKDVSCGMNQSFAIDEYGMMWGWGYNGEENLLGLTDEESVNKPMPINYDHDWENVFTFGNSTFAIKTDGSLWGWGYNRNGKLGVGYNELVYVPTKIDEKGPWKQVHSSEKHTLALKKDGTLWAWGGGKNEIGVGLDTVSTPQKVNDDTDWVDIACGNGFSLALKADSSFWCWGQNNYGTFGHYEELSYSKPTKIILRNAVSKIINIDAGEESAIALGHTGQLHLFAPQGCGQMSFKIDENPYAYRNLYSNYDGFNVVTSIKGWLLASSSSFQKRSELLNIQPMLFKRLSEQNDWIKATMGNQHILALRGEYITNVREQRQLVDVSIYPNPSLSNINIDFDIFYSNISISIYDVYGRLVLEDGSSNTDRITINHNLPHGTYIIQCRDGNSLIVDQILVVE